MYLIFGLKLRKINLIFFSRFQIISSPVTFVASLCTYCSREIKKETPSFCRQSLTAIHQELQLMLEVNILSSCYKKKVHTDPYDVKKILDISLFIQVK